jgi:hypothetical protein
MKDQEIEIDVNGQDVTHDESNLHNSIKADKEQGRSSAAHSNAVFYPSEQDDHSPEAARRESNQSIPMYSTQQLLP